MLSVLFSTVMMGFLLSIKGRQAGWWGSGCALGLVAFTLSVFGYQEMAGVVLLGSMLFIDYLSWILVGLAFFICPLCIVASTKVYNKSISYKGFLLCIVFTAFSLTWAFSCMNWLLFYFWFESSMIPLLCLVMKWGYQPERVQAASYLLLYTMASSLPFLGVLGWVYVNCGSLFLWGGWLSLPEGSWWVVVFFPFFVKSPLYGVHSWLPKAHVEAPVAGSMLLAGLTLKLGGYGMMRVMEIFKVGVSGHTIFFMVAFVWGSLLTSFTCSRQDDIKSLVAYSSVSHMGLIGAGILTNSKWGWCGAVVLMVAHAFSSSGLFCLAGILYDAFGSRSLWVLGGVLVGCPVGLFFGFSLICGNMAAPFTMNLYGESLLSFSLVWLVVWSPVILGLVCFMAAVYSLHMYSWSFHGSRMMVSHSWKGMSECEMFLLWFHIVCMVFSMLIVEVMIVC